MKDYKVGNVIEIKNFGYFRVTDIKGVELTAKKCESKSPWEFTDEQEYLIDIRELDDNIKIITWYAAGVFDTLPKSIWG